MYACIQNCKLMMTFFKQIGATQINEFVKL